MSSTTGDRYEHDDYPTPPWAVERLLERVWLPGGPGNRWLEPCAGSGNVIRAVNGFMENQSRTGGKHPLWDACELQTRYADSLRPVTERRYLGDDFLSVQVPELSPRSFVDVAITNPPYSIAFDVLKRCRELASFVVLLLRVGFLEGGASDATAERGAFLDEDMPDVYVLPNRPPFSRSKKTGRWGTDSATYAWMVWGPERRREGRTGRLAITPREVRSAWTRHVDEAA